MKIREMTPVDASDFVLLLLGAPTEDPEQMNRCSGITRLEKVAFLVEQDTRFRDLSATRQDALKFSAFHYGPYTRELYDAVDLLVGIGLLRETKVAADSELDTAEESSAVEYRDLGALTRGTEQYVERVFELTDKGRYVARVLTERIGPDAIGEISRVKDRYGRLPLKTLLRHVYRTHPEMTVNSRIKDQL